MEYLGLIMRIALTMTLLLSGLAKVFDLKSSARIASSVGILPKSIARAFGVLLPFLEILLSVLLFLNYFPKIVAVVVELLFLSFLIANITVVAQKKDIACNCFGRLMRGTMGVGGIFHSLILLLCGAFVIFRPELSFVSFVQVSMPIEVGLIVLPAFGVFALGMISREISIPD